MHQNTKKLIQKDYKTILKKRIENEPRKFIQCVYGPRQVGKTTMVRAFADASKLPTIFLSADAISETQTIWISQQWELARLQMKRESLQEMVLIIDEIQKISDWSEQVKKEWDQDSRNNLNLKVIILGSSRLLLQQGLTESLAGRFETMYIPHWNFTAMKTTFDFTAEDYLWFGGYPGPATLIKDEERWRHYILDSLIETTVSKDILMLTRIEKPALLKRLFELGCSYSSMELSYTKLLGQLQDAGNTVTLSHYLQLLDQAGLLAGLEKYAGQKVRQRASSPKFQVHNNALLSAQYPKTRMEALTDPSTLGRLVESAVGAHLINASLEHGFKLWYWRNGNLEVDFVMEQRSKLVAIEVKSGMRVKTSGMAQFKKEFDPSRLVLISSDGLSWEEFLSFSPMELF